MSTPGLFREATPTDRPAMSWFRWTLILGLVLAAGIHGFGVEVGKPLPVGGRLPVRTFGLEQGMVNTNVSALCQDARGVLWAGTEAGLHRFDGFGWHLVSVPLPSTMISSLCAGPDGALWIGTREGTVCLRNGRVELARGLPVSGTLVAGLDGEGRIWSHTTAQPYAAGTDGHFHPVGSWSGQEFIVQVVPAPRRARTLVLTARELLELDEAHQAWIPSPMPALKEGERLLGAAYDGEGTLWLATRDRLLRHPMRGAWGAVELGGARPLSTQFQPLRGDREGWVWLASDRGLLRVKAATCEVLAPPASEMIAGIVDRDGSPWFFGSGIQQVLSSGRWRVFDRQDGLPRQAVWGVGRDRTGRVWATTYGGVSQWTGSVWKTVLQTHAVGLSAGPNGELVTAGRPGGRVLRLVPGSERVEEIVVPGLEGEQESSAVVDGMGRLLVLTQSRRLMVGTPEGAAWKWRSAPLPDGLQRHPFQTLVRTQDFQVFLFAGAQLFSWSGADWEVVGGTLAGAPWLAASDGRGRLVVGYLGSQILTVHRRQGEGRYEREQEIRALAAAPQFTTYALQFDSAGTLWVGTSRGLYGLRAEGGLVVHGPGEGIPNPDVAYQGLLADGEGLWVCTAGGIGYLTPARSLEGPPPAPLMLAARSGPRALDPESLRLGPRERSLEVDVVVPSYARPKSLRLEARWPDLGDVWQELTGARLAVPSLPPGHHRLEVRARLVEGHFGPPLTATVVVAPAWFEGWLMRVGVGTLVMLSGIGLFRLWQRRLVRQNARLQAEVEARTRDLERASEAKSAFLAGMSHELRTPLNAVLLYSELLGEDARERGDEDMARDLGRVQGAGRHLLALVNGILDISKIEAGRMDLARERVDVRLLLQEMRFTLLPLAEVRDTVLEVEAPEGLLLDVDDLKLRQILINLGGNAAKFTERGRVTITAREEGDGVGFRVADTGIGMDPEAVARLFRPYEQVSSGMKHRLGGTGLGLALTLRLVELMAGRITVDTAPGKGSTFTLWLPKVGPEPTEGG